ncbi:MAG: hypothetical protein ABR599_05480 [Gemmatimonadota bacterium]
MGAPVLMVVFPVAFFPFSKTVWLAFDLAFRPATWSELAPVGPDEKRGRGGPPVKP